MEGKCHSLLFFSLSKPRMSFEDQGSLRQPAPRSPRR